MLHLILHILYNQHISFFYNFQELRRLKELEEKQRLERERRQKEEEELYKDVEKLARVSQQFHTIYFLYCILCYLHYFLLTIFIMIPKFNNSLFSEGDHTQLQHFNLFMRSLHAIQSNTVIYLLNYNLCTIYVKIYIFHLPRHCIFQTQRFFLTLLGYN